MSHKEKSLRAPARELGVRHSYLLQIKHGKRTSSSKMASKVLSNMIKCLVILNTGECRNWQTSMT